MEFLLISILSVIAVISVCGCADTNAVSLNTARFKCTKTGPVCSDCSTLMLCSSLREDPLIKMTCTYPNEYCVDGACTSDPGSSCKGSTAGNSSFVCTDVGIFPDPSDCTRYHICERGSVHSFYCDTGFVFNSKLKMCQVDGATCTRMNCSKASEANTFIPYDSDPAYYAFCTKDDKGYSALMFKCPNEDFEEFDVKTKTCQFQCKAKGNFQNPNDCGKYFYCAGNNAEPISAKCPGELVFDGVGCNRDKDKCQYKPQVHNGNEDGGNGNNGGGNSTAGNSTVGNSTAGNAENSTVGNDTAENSTVGNSTGENGTVGNSTAGNSTAGNSTVGNSTVGNSTVGSSTAGNSTAGNSTVGSNTAGNSTAGNSTYGSNTAGNITVGNSTVGNSTVGNSAVGNGAAGNSTVGNSTIGNSTVGNGTNGNGTAGNGTALNITIGNNGGENNIGGNTAGGNTTGGINGNGNGNNGGEMTQCCNE